MRHPTAPARLQPSLVLRSMQDDLALVTAPAVEAAWRLPGRTVESWRLCYVEESAPPPVRRAVECLARMFRREFSYDFHPYDAEAPEGARAVLWVSNDETYPRAIGAGGFYGKKYTNLPERVTEFGWMWVHPYHRRRGLLAASWPALLEKFGPFGVQRPLSPAMSAFLADKPRRELMTTDPEPEPYSVFVPAEAIAHGLLPKGWASGTQAMEPPHG